MAKRRGRGEGSIEQLPSGKWRAIYTNGKKPDGSQRKVAATFDRHRDAVVWLNEQLSMRSKGICEPSRMTLDVWMRAWLRAARQKVDPATWEDYERICLDRIIPILGDCELGQLTPLLVHQAMGTLADDGVSTGRQRRILQLLRFVLKDACKMKLIYSNPAADVDPPKKIRREMKCWSKWEARLFLDSVRGHRHYALFLLALDSGMRQGELLGLRWPNVFMSEGWVAVRHSLQKVKGKLTLKEPKTAKAKRDIWIGKATVEALTQHRAKLAASGHDVVRGPVFPARRGGWFDRDSLRTTFQRLMAKAGQPVIRFHDLRHTNATLLMGAGVGIKTVSERLGHASVAFTLETYTHVLPGEQKEVGTVANKLFGQESHPNPTAAESSTSVQQSESPQVLTVDELASALGLT